MFSNIFDQNSLYPCNGHANVTYLCVFGHDVSKEIQVVIFSLLEVVILIDITTCKHGNESYHTNITLYNCMKQKYETHINLHGYISYGYLTRYHIIALGESE